MSNLSMACRLIPVILLWLTSIGTHAASEDVTEQIWSLIQQQQYEQAFAEASAQQSEYEGDENFDYAFAVAAKSIGELNQAVFAFERVLQTKPNAHDARFGLALCYYELGNLAAAEQELQLLASINSGNNELNEAIQTYLSQIAKQQQKRDRHWISRLEIGLGSDSNPNNGVADEFISIPGLGTVSLFDESREQSSGFAAIFAETAYIQPINQHSSWHVGASVLHAAFTEDAALSRTFLTANAAYLYQIDNYKVAATLFYRPLWLDGDSLLDHFGVTGSVSRPFASNNVAGVDLTIAREDYNEFKGFDRDQWILDGWLQKLIGNGLHRIAFTLGQETATDAQPFLERDLWGLSYQWRYQYDRHWEYSASLDYLDSEYQGQHPLFATTRQDQFFSANLGVRYALTEQFTLRSSLHYLNNDSDIAIYQYSRVKLWLGASYEF